MIFRGLKEDNGWIVIDYSATWRYGYDFMLDAAQVVIDTDFQNNLKRVATSELANDQNVERLEEVMAHHNILRDCSNVKKECSILVISGISRIMECPVQFAFFNQTNVVRLFCPVKQLFQEHGERMFDNYMNSIEIKAYCKDTERRTLEKLKYN